MGYFLYLSAETWTLLVALITLVFVYSTWTFGTFKKLGVPGPKPIPLFGTMLAYKKGFTNFDEQCFKKYGKTWGIFDGRQPVLCITDPAMIKTVLIKECYSFFTNRRNFRLNGPLYDAVSIAEDDQWRRIRSVLSPSFTSGRLKENFHLSMRNDETNENYITIICVCSFRFFGPYSMDVVASTAFSVDIDSLNNPSDPFVTNIKKMLKFDLLDPLFLAVALFPFLGPIFEKMEFSFFPTSVTDFFYASLQKIKSSRETIFDCVCPQNRVDFLQLMIDSQKNLNGGDKDKALSDHEILSQAMIFLFAGYETTSSTLTFLAYNLATNPDVMKKLQQEIDATFPNKGPIEYQALMDMDYLDAAINESLRLYPIAARLERVAKASVEINGLVIPKDMVVMVPTWPLHRDPEIWPEPERFKPERFTKGNKETIDPYTYMPFGMGPRNCIGMRFALVSMKLALVEVLQKFSFSVCKETEVPFEMDVQGLLSPKRPIKLKLEPRS
uniref:unspecific monooxygenase n=1 Tax=Salarias fasciatus TaxID=181472 RepID=A0A672IHB6_SALFA